MTMITNMKRRAIMTTKETGGPLGIGINLSTKIALKTASKNRKKVMMDGECLKCMMAVALNCS